MCLREHWDMWSALSLEKLLLWILTIPRFSSQKLVEIRRGRGWNFGHTYWFSCIPLFVLYGFNLSQGSGEKAVPLDLWELGVHLGKVPCPRWSDWWNNQIQKAHDLLSLVTYFSTTWSLSSHMDNFPLVQHWDPCYLRPPAVSRPYFDDEIRAGHSLQESPL